MIKNKDEKSFEDKIARLSIKTRQSIVASMNSFERFTQDYYTGKTTQDIFDELNILDEKQKNQALREVLQSWIDWLYQNGGLTSSVQQYISKIKKIFSHNGINIHIDDFQEPLEFMPKIKEELHELTVEEIQKIFQYTSPKKLSFYLALSCSGARPSELLQIRKKDIDTSKKRIKIRIEAENTKTRTGRSIWLTKEAGSYLMTKLNSLDDDDLVWATNENVSFAEKNESTQFNRFCEKAGFTEKYKSNGYRQITLYSFRSFFFGKASDTHREGYAHKMIGHGGYLPQYDRMSDSKKLEWYIELESNLTIDPTERQKMQLEEQNKKLNELEEKSKRIDELEKKFYLQDGQLEELKKQIIKDLTEKPGKLDDS